MITSTVTISAGVKYSSSRDTTAGPIFFKIGGWEHCIQFENAAAVEECYEALAAVLAGLRFDAMEWASKAEANGLKGVVAEIANLHDLPIAEP